MREAVQIKTGYTMFVSSHETRFCSFSPVLLLAKPWLLSRGGAKAQEISIKVKEKGIVKQSGIVSFYNIPVISVQKNQLPAGPVRA